MKKVQTGVNFVFLFALIFSGCIFKNFEAADGVSPDTDAGDVSVDGTDTTEDTGEDTVDPDTDTSDDVRDTRDGDTDMPDGDTDMDADTADPDTGDADVFDPDACNPNNPPTWYKDVDGDGYGNIRKAIDSCQRPTDENGIPYAPEAGDCNFLNSQVYPGASEICNDDDNNCDGIKDNKSDGVTFYKDVDGDGFGDPSNTMNFCSDTEPREYVRNDEDCDDTTPTVGGFEDEAFFDQSGQLVDYCNDGLDNDCNQDGVDGNDSGCMDDDGDTAPNAVDPIYPTDTNSDGKDDAICVEVDETIDPAWHVDTYYQGSPTIWGGYQTIDTNQVVSYDATNNRWCHTYLGVGQTGTFHFRLVSTLDVNQNSATTNCQNGWKVPDIRTYCDAFSQQDPYCRGLPFDDGCGNRMYWGLTGQWDHTTSELTTP